MQTYGWDFVCAIRADKINQSLDQYLKETPLAVDYRNGSAAVSATFSVLQLVAGGANKLLHVELQVDTGTISLGERDWDLTRTRVVVEVQLAFIDNVDVSHVKDLKFYLRAAGKKSGDTTDGAISLVTSHAAEGGDPQAAHAFGDHVVECLLANKDKLAYIFASINLQQPGGGSWMTPQQSHYCYLQGPVQTQPGYLAILSGLTDEFDPEKCPLKVDPAVLSPDAELSLAVSSRAFLQHVIAPALPEAVGHGTTANSFSYDPGDPTVVNLLGPVSGIGMLFNRGSLVYGGLSITIQGGKIPLRAEIPPGSLRISAECSDIVMRSNGLAPLMKSSRVYFSTSSKTQFRYDLKTGSASLQKDAHPTSTSKLDLSDADEVSLIKDCAGFLMADFIEAIISEFSRWGQGIAADLAAGIGLSDVSSLLSAGISWTDCDEWNYTEIALDDALYARANAR